MTLDPHVALLAVISTGAGAVMLRLGLRARLLDPVRQRRRCAACGRLATGRRCPRCEP